MKNEFLVLCTAAILLLSCRHSFADPATTTNTAAATNTNAGPGTAIAELKELITKINAGIQQGKKTEASQADNLPQFDALLAKHKGETNNEVAQILYMEAMLYTEVFENSDKARQLFLQLKHDFPDSVQSKRVDSVLADIQRHEESKKIQATLVPYAKFPDFTEQDLDGKPLSISEYKGKVVLVDFWATWCVPCQREVPHLVQVYKDFHDKGLEIIGVSLDKAEDKDKLLSFTKEHGMTWREYFDGLGGENKLALKYGIEMIPMSVLIDREGNMIAKGDDLAGLKLDVILGRILAGK